MVTIWWHVCLGKRFCYGKGSYAPSFTVGQFLVWFLQFWSCHSFFRLEPKHGKWRNLSSIGYSVFKPINKLTEPKKVLLIFCWLTVAINASQTACFEIITDPKLIDLNIWHVASHCGGPLPYSPWFCVLYEASRKVLSASFSNLRKTYHTHWRRKVTCNLQREICYSFR